MRVQQSGNMGSLNACFEWAVYSGEAMLSYRLLVVTCVPISDCRKNDATADIPCIFGCEDTDLLKESFYDCLLLSCKQPHEISQHHNTRLDGSYTISA